MVTSKLRSLGLWPSDAGYARLVRQRLMRGEVLFSHILPTSLGAVEFRALACPRSNTARNSRRRLRFANLLTFGYEIAHAFSTIQRWDPTEESGPEIAALLNLGFGLFDYQCDQVQDGACGLIALFDRSTLNELFESSENAIILRNRASSVEQKQLRVLLKIISDIFIRLHKIHRFGVEFDRNWELLRGWMFQSLDAQIRTLSTPSIEHVEIKSTGPLQIILFVMRLTRPLNIEDSGSKEFQFASALARAIWLVDDIADLQNDFRSGSANSILLAADDHHAKNALQESMQYACDAAVESIKAVSEALLHEGDDAGSQVERALLSYIRSWLS